MSNPIEITLYEHETKDYKDIKGDKKTIQDALFKLNRQFKKDFRRLDKSEDNPDSEGDIDESKGVVGVYANKVKARHYVGFAAVDNVFIQILPKVFRPKGDAENEENTWSSIMAFVRMLDRAYGMKVKTHDLAYIKGRKLRPNLREVFIYLFAKSLWDEVQRGYHREYIELQSDENFLRGKLLLSRQIMKLPHRRHTFSVEVHELIEDNLLNRIFYASIGEAMRKTTWGINRKLLGELVLAFDGVTPIRLSTEHFERVHFTRLNERFKRPFELAKLLFMPPKGQGKTREISGFFVDMNRLFEQFMVSVLSKYAFEHGYKLTTNRDPENRKNLFSRKPPNATLKNQYPDYVLSKESKFIVLDAKYTEVVKKDKNNEETIELNPNIARQLYVYSRIWGWYPDNQCERDSKPPAVIIVPSSSTYNQGLSDGPLDFEFFDGRELFVIAYNMEYLKNGNVSKADEKFEEALKGVFTISNGD